MKRILVIAEKNKKPEALAEEAMIFPRIKGLSKRLWTGKLYRNFRLSENAWITKQRILFGQEKNIKYKRSREGR